ncbi:helix-turn-helix domain-containing protein [Ottowia thiooxydans]|uniref:helix-turn-helix domain-containing protein n=1 Tax=Ottowia thiooxydans TaxID=219182 RepID=UPI000A045A24|nr:helix-turn-helix domain-containing protein [Ottowia thiooxydans]
MEYAQKRAPRGSSVERDSPGRAHRRSHSPRVGAGRETPLPPTEGLTRSIQRALLVLRALNEREIWSLQDLQQRTGLPKTTVHRLLATLQAEHYVHSGEEMYGQYRLTHHVRNLSSGFVEKNRLADIAGPILVGATKKMKWPLAVGVIDGAEVRANLCTMPYSPYSMKPTCFGQRYGLLDTALGTAYLSYCSASERRILVQLLREQGLADATFESKALRSLVRRTRRQGYGLRAGVRPDESSALAVPLHARSGELLGVLGCSTFSQSMGTAWIDRVLPFVRDAAAQIQERY